MTTKQLIETYFNKIKEKSDWQIFIAQDVKFESPATGTTLGKDTLIEAASRFFKMVETLEVKHVVSEGNKVNAWVTYTVLSESGKTYNCLVSELLEVRNDQIVSSSIMFDTLALKTFRSEN